MSAELHVDMAMLTRRRRNAQRRGPVQLSMTGLVILLVALGAATAFGLYRAASDGRFTGTREVRGAGQQAAASTAAPDSAAQADDGVDAADPAGPAEASLMLTAEDLGEPLGERATLVQFSSAFCAPCRAARRVLGEVAAERQGVTHVEIDAESHLELVRSVGVMRTPTTLVLDPGGREIARASGAPTKAQVSESLSALA